jgi:4a-hydroxytetrahydrobiopterin dehydratase
MPSLSDIEIQRGLGSLPGWSRKGDTLVKTYHFATFPAGIAFLARVAEIAESMAHHPDVDIRYTKVHFVLCTHDQACYRQGFCAGDGDRELAVA